MKLPGKLHAVQVITGEFAGEWLASEKESELGNSFPYVPESEAERLRERVAKLEQDNDKLTALLVCEDETIHRLEGALEKIAKADCPNYIAHPQSVWWETHVLKIAREALGGGEGK